MPDRQAKVAGGEHTPELIIVYVGDTSLVLLDIGRQPEICIEIRSFNPISTGVVSRCGEQHVPKTPNYLWCCPEGCANGRLFSKGLCPR